MNWEKMLAIGIAAYLAFSLPLYFLNSQAVQECKQACSQQGFDVVTSATSLGTKECSCFDSLTRQEKQIVLGN